MSNHLHQPVMLNEAVSGLNVLPEHWYIDATFGRGGHTQAILNKHGKVIAFDCDQTAINYGREHFAEQLEKKQVFFVWANFDRLEVGVQNLRDQQPIDKIDGILYDFGTAADQLTSGERGFSFNENGPLDMRMDQRLSVQAKDLLLVLNEKELANLFSEYGGEREARAIAKAIKASPQPIVTTDQLAQLVTSVKHQTSRKLHPATKVFQALRMAVNSEPDRIQDSLPQAIELVCLEGRIISLAFHEGEDRIVKQTFKNWQVMNRGKILTKKALRPTEEEVATNPRSRSAKLRIFEKNGK